MSEAVADRDWWGSWPGALLAVVAWCLWSELRLHGSRGGPWSRSDTVHVAILLAFAGFTGSAAIFGYVPTYERYAGAAVGVGLLWLAAYFIAQRRRTKAGSDPSALREAQRA